jgi:anti-sigma B factor antagonist
MAVAVDQVGAIRRVSLEGRLDVAGVEAVEAEFNAAATAEPNVIVDLSGVPFLASLGVRMLVAASQDQEKIGGKLVLAGPDELTRRILWTTGINQLIPVADTAEEAAGLF